MSINTCRLLKDTFDEEKKYLDALKADLNHANNKSKIFLRREINDTKDGLREIIKDLEYYECILEPHLSKLERRI